MDVVGSWVGGSETENMNWSESNGKYPSSMERFTTETIVALSKPGKGSVENGSLSSMNLKQVNSRTPPIRIECHTISPLVFKAESFLFLQTCTPFTVMRKEVYELPSGDSISCHVSFPLLG